MICFSPLFVLYCYNIFLPEFPIICMFDSILYVSMKASEKLCKISYCKRIVYSLLNWFPTLEHKQNAKTSLCCNKTIQLLTTFIQSLQSNYPLKVVENRALKKLLCISKFASCSMVLHFSSSLLTFTAKFILQFNWLKMLSRKFLVSLGSVDSYKNMDTV